VGVAYGLQYHEGVVVSSGYIGRQPGLSARGTGSGSVKGSRISGLIGMSSRKPHPVFSTVWTSTGVWSTHCAAHEAFPPTITAALDSELYFSISRRVSLNGFPLSIAFSCLFVNC
jgi:hypothetical protein